MSAIINTTFQALEGLASSGLQYGDGTADANSSTLQPLTGSAWQDQHHPGGALTLPELTMTFSMLEGGQASGALVLPRLTADGWGGGWAKLALPLLVVTGTGTVPTSGIGALVLPQLVISGHAISGVLGRAALRLPRLRVAGWFAGRGALTLPRLAVAGNITTEETGTGALILPLLAVSGTGVVESYPGYGVLVLPALVGGPYTTAYLTLPLLQVSGYGAGVVGALAATAEGWALNLRTGFVGRITNWPFKRVVKWGDKLLGVGDAGLYLIGGDEDAGGVIPWEWRTGLSDLGQPGIKRIPVLYLDAIIDGEVFIVTKDDRGDVRRYRYEADRGRIHLPHRRNLGMGVRTRNIAIGMANGPAGAYMELDGLEPEATVTQRSV